MNSVSLVSLPFYIKGSKFLSGCKAIFSSTRYDKKIAYDSLSRYADPNSYLDILNDTAYLNPLRTNADIDIDILGANTTSTLSKYGKPDFIFTENKLTIFLYEKVFNDLMTRYEIHFYNKKTFSVHYIYKNIYNSDKKHLVKSVVTRYLCDDIDESDIYKSKIVDKNSSTVFLNNLPGGLEVTYLSNSGSDWFNSMTSAANAIKFHENAKSRLAINRRPALPNDDIIHNPLVTIANPATVNSKAKQIIGSTECILNGPVRSS